jgi:hypothetical protein
MLFVKMPSFSHYNFPKELPKKRKSKRKKVVHHGQRYFNGEQ